MFHENDRRANVRICNPDRHHEDRTIRPASYRAACPRDQKQTRPGNNVPDDPRHRSPSGARRSAVMAAGNGITRRSMIPITSRIAVRLLGWSRSEVRSARPGQTCDKRFGRLEPCWIQQLRKVGSATGNRSCDPLNFAEKNGNFLVFSHVELTISLRSLNF